MKEMACAISLVSVLTPSMMGILRITWGWILVSLSKLLKIA